MPDPVPVGIVRVPETETGCALNVDETVVVAVTVETVVDTEVIVIVLCEEFWRG